MSTVATERAKFEAALAALLAGLSSSSTILPDRQVIIDYVKAKLDEIVPSGTGITFALSADPNTLNNLDLLINGHLDESTKNIQMIAPLSVLHPTSAVSPTGVAYTDTKTGYVVLPLNFRRLSAFKMTQWFREVTEAVAKGSPIAKKQSNPYLRGGLAKPVAVLGFKDFSNGGLKTLTIAAGGTGYTPGSVILTVVQSGGANGTIRCTASSGGVITSIDDVLTQGTGYTVANTLATTGGGGTNCTVNLTVIEGMRRILDYYTVTSGVAVDYLLYIPESLAEEFVHDNPDLLDALAWQCAGKIMQITGQGEGAKMAQERVNQCLLNNPQ